MRQNSSNRIFWIRERYSKVDYVKVKWLSGIEDVIYNVAANQTLNITEGSTLSQSEYSVDNKVIGYPNPIKDIFNLTSKEMINKVELITQLGEKLLIKHTQNKRLSLNLETFESGIYYLNIYQSTAIKTIKLVKI